MIPASKVLFTVLALFLDPLVSRASRARHVRQAIASDVDVTADWSEFVLKLPKRPTNRRQEISLTPEGCKCNEETDELIFSDGTVINPETDIDLEISDAAGNIFDLKPGRYGIRIGGESGTWNVSSAGFAMPWLAGTDVLVRIRSDKPFRCKTIDWHNYSLK